MPRDVFPTDDPPASSRFWLVWSCGLLAWGAALLLAAPHDLQLSRAVVDPRDLIGRVVGPAGELPSWGLFAAALVVLAARRRREQIERWTPFAWAMLLQTALCPGLATQLLKHFWGRVRYLHLAADAARYTPFYVPAGVGAGRSFPSGHTAMAFASAPLPFFVAARGGRLATLVSWLLVLGYGVVVAWGRVVAGKHFLTDTLFSAGLGLLVAPLLVRYLLRRHRAGVSASGER